MSLMFTRVETVEETAEVARLAAEIWREYYVSIITMEQIDYMIGRFQSVQAITEQIHQQGYGYYLVHNRDSAVGYFSARQEEGKLFLSKFYIGKEYRGRGYASQAMGFLEQLCQDHSLSHIWLTVNRHNSSSIAVYEKKGFRTVREQVSDIGNGFVMDDFVMEKEILIGAETI
ncbi:GNAT family acetyltransferase [Paenibacillus sp. FSL R7-0273]|uniref:GNAT family N-acetyltransferase n=1 Tax=Paenibacillus sp. FSL R7-0273 TaxID=1536772 RepID=UPI0004F6DB33|nr:GNAT family N-acetyltransferase [Paenibacillus sp. FSL R7-0273]AIQ47145.1 GNAT family acetyltransferase [Paenibacillus sp. FSL R7-0273]OMF97101.1 GNAT family N-acetyltransferase [Paenibacillus sp. FSL R7-0273]